MNQEQVALVVMSCDAYADAAQVFFRRKERCLPWWKGGCYYLNNEAEFIRPGVTTIHCGNDRNWSGRLRYALSQLEQKYVLYMQEDYFIGAPVREEDYLQALEYIEREGIWYYKLDDMPKIRKLLDPNHSAIPGNVRYGINLLTAVIDREKLLELLPQEDVSAWEVEAGFLKSVTDRYEGNLPGCVLDIRQLFHVQYGIRHGKWWRKTLRFFRRQGDPIPTGDRPVMGRREAAALIIKDAIAHHMPTKLFRRAKRLLLRLGFHFVSQDN